MTEAKNDHLTEKLQAMGIAPGPEGSGSTASSGTEAEARPKKKSGLPMIELLLLLIVLGALAIYILPVTKTPKHDQVAPSATTEHTEKVNSAPEPATGGSAEGQAPGKPDESSVVVAVAESTPEPEVGAKDAEAVSDAPKVTVEVAESAQPGVPTEPVALAVEPATATTVVVEAQAEQPQALKEVSKEQLDRILQAFSSETVIDSATPASATQ